jgi:hypothetical protein
MKNDTTSNILHLQTTDNLINLQMNVELPEKELRFLKHRP